MFGFPCTLRTTGTFDYKVSCKHDSKKKENKSSVERGQFVSAS